MRGVKAAILLGYCGLLIWGLVNVGQLAIAEYPAWKFWHAGAAAGCIYALFDLFDRWREWLGFRREPRARRQMFHRYWQ